MARPIKPRQIYNVPKINSFIPSEKTDDNISTNVLKVEELEAIRLKDIQKIEQNECAEKMKISRPTFRRILISAREKIADSLLNGKAIVIEGGDFTRNICILHCYSCGHSWDERYESISSQAEMTKSCPACGSQNVGCEPKANNEFCRGRCHRYGRGRH